MNLNIFQAIQKVRSDRKKAQRMLEKSYRELEVQLAYQEALEERERRNFTFGDMQDIVKSVSRGVVANIKFADGTTVVLRSEDPLVNYQQKLNTNGGMF